MHAKDDGCNWIVPAPRARTRGSGTLFSNQSICFIHDRRHLFLSTKSHKNKMKLENQNKVVPYSCAKLSKFFISSYPSFIETSFKPWRNCDLRTFYFCTIFSFNNFISWPIWQLCAVACGLIYWLICWVRVRYLHVLNVCLGWAGQWIYGIYGNGFVWQQICALLASCPYLARVSVLSAIKNAACKIYLWFIYIWTRFHEH